MPGIDMELQHPIDAELRRRLRELGPNQIELARAIGRKQPWLNKYMQGGGKATIDDVIRIIAVLIGVETQSLTDVERRILKAVRTLPEERREDAVLSLEASARRYRTQHPKSGGQTRGTPQTTKNTGRGTR